MSRPQTSNPVGFLAVDKPAGWTSHDVVARVRRLSGVRRVGHAGTLDPFATGLLVLAIGKATRLIQYVQNTEKTYQATFKLGTETDTLDIEGKVVHQSDVPRWPGLDDIRRTLSNYVGTIEQTPPAFSAVHVAGRRAYELARAGEEIEIPARTVEIMTLDIERYAPPLLNLTITCSPGTYVRSLARDIGRDLGTFAFCQSLRRTASGTFNLDAAITIENLEPTSFQERWSEIVLPPDSAVAAFDSVTLSEKQTTAWYHGQSLGDVSALPESGTESIVRAYDANGRFAGLGQVITGHKLRPVLVFITD